MIYTIPANKDATIYEKYPYKNTGIDPILELSKNNNTINTTSFYESRILLYFDILYYQLDELLNKHNITLNDINVWIKLNVVSEQNIPNEFFLIASPILENWNNGTGLFNNDNYMNYLEKEDGVTWDNVAGLNSTKWVNIINQDSEIKYNINPGGGSWLSDINGLKRFTYKSNDDYFINITNIFKYWSENNFNNNKGLIISYSDNILEIPIWNNNDTNWELMHPNWEWVNYPNGNVYSAIYDTKIQFHSSETHTVFEPQLYIQWQDNQTYNTNNSDNIITKEDIPIIYLINFNGSYIENNLERVYVGCREKYPKRTFSRNSIYSTNKRLPIKSYYQIVDNHNNNIIIPYSDYTIINATNDNNYFDFYTNMLYKERFYRFDFKLEYENGDIDYISDRSHYSFKIL